MLILWQATLDAAPEQPYEPGISVSGRYGDYRVSVGGKGMTYAGEDVSGLPTAIEFDAGSLVLTAFGRSNSGTVRGGMSVAERFLNQFFRI